MRDSVMEVNNSMGCEINNCFLEISGYFDNFEPDKHFERIERLLKKLTNKFKDAICREKVVKTHIETISKVLCKCNESLTKDYNEDVPSEITGCITECYRTLRNACAESKTNQDLMVECVPSCIDCCEATLKPLARCSPERTRSHHTLAEDKVILLRCCVQFLGNVVAGHPENSKLVWSQFSKSFRSLLCLEDEKLTQYVCMAIHSCIQGGWQDNDWSSQLGTDQDFLQIVCDILSAVTDTDLEWGIYVVEDAMRIKGVLEVIDEQQSEKQRIFALEVLLGQLRSMSEGRHLDPDPCDGVKADGPCMETLQYLSKEVTTNAYNILILASQDTQIESTPNLQPEVIVKQIEALGEATSNHTVYGALQENGDLLTSSVYLLEAIHKLGKDSTNTFSSVAKLASDDVDTDHPVFGLRKDLVRLIGNMCFRHKANQERAANLNALPLILDQTNIDKKNPYITQWAILAVRNICEDCPENKAVLAGLKKQGIADNSAVLRELGMDAEVRGDKIYVTPPNKEQ